MASICVDRCSGMGRPEGIEAGLAAKFQALLPHLDERQRRLAIGAEARSLGHGGIRLVAAAAGVREGTVSRGVAELESGQAPLGRVRRPGGGRKKATELRDAPCYVTGGAEPVSVRSSQGSSPGVVEGEGGPSVSACARTLVPPLASWDPGPRSRIKSAWTPDGSPKKRPVTVVRREGAPCRSARPSAPTTTGPGRNLNALLKEHGDRLARPGATGGNSARPLQARRGNGRQSFRP